jgi:hypothetical protein
MDYLALLVVAAGCPIGMGVMVWMMMRMRRTEDRPAAMTAQLAGAPRPEDRLTALRAELDQIRARQIALQMEVDRLAAGGPQAVPDAVALGEAARPAAAPARQRMQAGNRLTTSAGIAVAVKPRSSRAESEHDTSRRRS